MHEEFRYPDRPQPTHTSSLVLWLMASVVLAGSVVLGVTLADRETADMQLAAARAASTTSSGESDRAQREPVVAPTSTELSRRSPSMDRSGR